MAVEWRDSFIPQLQNTDRNPKASFGINLRHYFSGIYGAPASKLENLRHIQELTRAKLDEIFFVGDSEDDRMAAAALGCHFAGVILDNTSRFRQIPTLHVKHLEELRGIVENIQEKQHVLSPHH